MPQFNCGIFYCFIVVVFSGILNNGAFTVDAARYNEIECISPPPTHELPQNLVGALSSMLAHDGGQRENSD